jgi:uncharacterized protein YndB with AHSA1/START domain
MELKTSAMATIEKPLAEVFDAVYNPKKIAGYFVTKGASGPLEPGPDVMWEFHDFPGAFPIHPKETIQNQMISFEWGEPRTLVTFTFEAAGANATNVSISETGWNGSWEKSIKDCIDKQGGWMNMICCLKVYCEYGKNLRETFFNGLREKKTKELEEQGIRTGVQK